MGKGHSQRKRDAKKRKAEAEAMAAQTSSASAPSANYQRSLLAGASSELASATQLEPAPAPAMSEQDRRNYERFLKFLLKFAVITSYTIYVSYDSMLQHNDVDLIVAICNSHTRSHRATDAHLILFRALRIGYFLLPVNSYAMKILETKTADGRTTKTCIRFSESFPESVYRLKDSVKYPDLVQSVKIFEGEMYVLAPTVHGRVLLVACMALISENHSNGVSYSGDFTVEDILMIKHKRSPNEIMEILKDPAEAEDTDEATVKDLRKAAEILMPLYKDGDGVYPVYFRRYKNDLEGATKELVAQEWFIRKYLCFHAAIMSSAARRSFELSLYSTREVCEEASKMFDEMVANMVNPSPPWHARNGTIPYTEGIRARRNYLVHGWKHKKVVHLNELELYVANRHGGFLPCLVQTMLEKGIMLTHFESAWSCLNPYCKLELSSTTNSHEETVT